MKHKRNTLSRNTKLLIAVIALLIVGQVAVDAYLLCKTHQAHDTVMLSLISQAIDGIYKPAAVEAKTGNSYFPEARLFVTAQPQNPELLYSYYADGDDLNFSVTASNVLSAGKSKMWSTYANEARHGDKAAFTAMFNEVPHLQACARGLQLYYQPQSQAGFTEQLHTTLANGKTIYGYTEAACQQDLSPVVDTFKTVQSY